MTRILTLLFFVFACFFSTALWAQEPIISIQGTLKDANGAAVADGEQSITFRLYHQETGGDIKYEETAQVSVVGGIYSHNLGSITPMPDSIFRTNIFLGVTVGGLELTPRTTMTYAPYALSVRATQKVAQGGCSGQVGDIKYSILNPTQFAEQNGDCWVPMDGRPIAGKALADYGYNNVPDMSGLFIRATEYNDGNDPDRSPMATASLQDHQMQSHNHYLNLNTNTTGAHTHSYTDRYQAYEDNGWTDGGADYANSTSTPDQTESAGDHSHNVQGWTTGPDISGGTVNHGSETRSKNMNFYIYIRVD